MRYSLLCLCLACTPSFGTQTTGGSSDVSNVNQDENNVFTQSGLPDLFDSMETDFCYDVQPDTPGATSYFVGTYIFDAGEWFGQEQWILHPTPDWTDTDGQTCYITWQMSGFETDSGACFNCDLSLSVSATINKQETDCPEGLWKGSEEHWSETYDIHINGTDTIFYFHGSGDTIGLGNANDNAVSFITAPSCTWF